MERPQVNIYESLKDIFGEEVAGGVTSTISSWGDPDEWNIMVPEDSNDDLLVVDLGGFHIPIHGNLKVGVLVISLAYLAYLQFLESLDVN